MSDIAVGASVRIVTTLEEVTATLRRARPLLDAVGVPFCADSIWLTTWYRTWGARPVVLAVEVGDEPVGLACLAVRWSGPVRTIVLAGHGPSDYGRLPARDGAAAALGRAVLSWLAGMHGPWRLEFSQLPVGDPVAAVLLAGLTSARLVEDQASPALRLDGERDPAALFPAKVLRELRRGRARLADAGAVGRIECASTPSALGPLLPEVVALHRERDHAVGRRSDLDPRRRREFYLDALTALAEAGQLEIWTLRVEAELAAFFVGVRDGNVYRIVDGRMGARWRTASTALILRVELITALLADPSIVEVDYMRGVLHHKMQDATHVVAAERLLAESSVTIARALGAWHQLAAAARRALPAGPRRRLLGLLTTVAARCRSRRAGPAAGRETPPPPDGEADNRARP